MWYVYIYIYSFHTVYLYVYIYKCIWCCLSKNGVNVGISCTVDFRTSQIFDTVRYFANLIHFERGHPFPFSRIPIYAYDFREQTLSPSLWFHIIPSPDILVQLDANSGWSNHTCCCTTFSVAPVPRWQWIEKMHKRPCMDSKNKQIGIWLFVGLPQGTSCLHAWHFPR